MMMLRPEFELLDSQFKRLCSNERVGREFLEKVRDNIELCGHIAETDIEKSVLVRTTYLWRKKASLFGMDLDTKLLPAPAGTAEGVKYTADDRRFLRSLRIVSDEDGGA